MTFTIEPMLNLGTHEWDMWDDDWTVVTKDRRRSAQFEHPAAPQGRRGTPLCQEGGGGKNLSIARPGARRSTAASCSGSPDIAAASRRCGSASS